MCLDLSLVSLLRRVRTPRSKEQSKYGVGGWGVVRLTPETTVVHVVIPENP